MLFELKILCQELWAVLLRLKQQVYKKQLKITKSKILNKSKETSIKDLTSSLKHNINEKSKIKYLD